MTLPETGADGGATVVAWLKEPGQPVELDEPICLVSWNGTTAEIGSPANGVLRMLAVGGGMTVPTGTSLALIDIRLAPKHEAEKPEADARVPEPEASEVEPEPIESKQVEEPEPEVVEPELTPEPGPTEDRTNDSAAPDGSTPRSMDEPDSADEPEPVAEPEAAGAPDPEPEPVPARLLRYAPVGDLRPVDLSGFHSPAVRGLARELQIDLDTVTGTGKRGRVTLRDVRACVGAPATSA
jgi:2-oxoisovalerate dehydrogenase E2 component (dihydrolipoyl transacylase)